MFTSSLYDNCTDPYFSSALFSQHLSELSTWNVKKKVEFTVFKVKNILITEPDKIWQVDCRRLQKQHKSSFSCMNVTVASERQAGRTFIWTITLTQSGWAYKRKLLGEENVYLRHVCYRYFQVLLILAASFEKHLLLQKSNEVTYLYVIFYEIYVSGPEHRY